MSSQSGARCEGEPLGIDRHKRKYWRFPSDPERLFVETKPIAGATGTDGTPNKSSSSMAWEHTGELDSSGGGGYGAGKRRSTSSLASASWKKPRPSKRRRRPLR